MAPAPHRPIALALALARPPADCRVAMLFLGLLATAAAAGGPALQAVSLPLSSVSLAPGSRLHAQQEANTAFLLNLDPVRLTCL